MKTILPVLILLSLLPARLSAIPQTVGPGFVNAVGVPFEQFAVARIAWAQGAELKGQWRARGSGQGGTETLELAMEADVFGIPAAEVVAERSGGAVRRFIVRFDSSKSKRAAQSRDGDLFARVTTNLRAMAGEPQAKSPGGEWTFRHEAALITARRVSAKEVVVEFRPAK